MGKVAGESPGDDDDDDDVAPLRGDGGGGVVGANHQFKRCDSTMNRTGATGVRKRLMRVQQRNHSNAIPCCP
jgi:hypothetical protein